MRYEIEVVERTREDAAIVRGQVRRDEIGGFIGSALGEVMGLQPLVVGPPFCRVYEAGEVFSMEVGFPVAQAIDVNGRVEMVELPAGTAATTIHVGAYDQVAGAYRALEAWFVESGHEPTGAPWESYLDEPTVPEPRTLVVWPCQRV